MTTPDKILVTLIEFPGTAEALAILVRVPELVVKANLDQHRRANLVDSETIHDVAFWSLTDSGRSKAETLKTTQLAL